MTLTAKKVFLTCGKGVHAKKLASFEMALRAASIAQFNLVRVSSIFPPGARIIKKNDGIKALKPGEIVYCVMSDIATNEPGRRIAASVGIAVPVSGRSRGYLSEHHSMGQTPKEAGNFAEDLAAEMLGSVLGLDINVDTAWDSRRGLYRFPSSFIRARNITASAKGFQGGKWTTCLAACVFILE